MTSPSSSSPAPPHPPAQPTSSTGTGTPATPSQQLLSSLPRLSISQTSTSASTPSSTSTSKSAHNGSHGEVPLQVPPTPTICPPTPDQSGRPSSEEEGNHKGGQVVDSKRGKRSDKEKEEEDKDEVVEVESPTEQTFDSDNDHDDIPQHGSGSGSGSPHRNASNSQKGQHEHEDQASNQVVDSTISEENVASGTSSDKNDDVQIVESPTNDDEIEYRGETKDSIIRRGGGGGGDNNKDMAPWSSKPNRRPNRGGHLWGKVAAATSTSTAEESSGGGSSGSRPGATQKHPPNSAIVSKPASRERRSSSSSPFSSSDEKKHCRELHEDSVQLSESPPSSSPAPAHPPSPSDLSRPVSSMGPRPHPFAHSQLSTSPESMQNPLPYLSNAGGADAEDNDKSSPPSPILMTSPRVSQKAMVDEPEDMDDDTSDRRGQTLLARPFSLDQDHHQVGRSKSESNATRTAAENPKSQTSSRQSTLSVGDDPRSVNRRGNSNHRVTETLDAKVYANESGQRMVNQYSIGPLLGRGAYGNVEKAINVETGVEYAIKEFSKARLRRQRQMTSFAAKRRARGSLSAKQHVREGSSSDEGIGKLDISPSASGGDNNEDDEDEGKDQLSLIRQEIAVMKKLNHPNIVLLYEAIDVPTSDSLYMVLEYLPGGTVIDISVGGDPATPLDEETTRDYFRQLLLGLEYLHQNAVAHRDIKPDNILLTADKKTVKLCDFGVSEMFAAGDDRIKQSAGSPAFMSPEAAISNEKDVHAKSVDIWALGVTLYCMLRGKLPFEASTPIALFEAIRDDPAPIPEQWNPDLKDINNRLLEKDPKKRIGMAELKEHPWVTKNGSEPMPSTEENLYDIGKEVMAPTAEEISGAITSWKGVFTVMRAIHKMKRSIRSRRQSSNSSSSTTAPSGSSTPAILSPSNGPTHTSPLQLRTNDFDSEFTASPVPTLRTSSLDDVIEVDSPVDKVKGKSLFP